MGDGVSDLGWRGELGSEGTKRYIRSQIRASDGGLWKLHETSTKFLSNKAALIAMDDAGEIYMDSFDEDSGWWIISEAR